MGQQYELDFTNVTPASGGLAVLATGWYKGLVGEVKVFNNDGGGSRVAFYIDTPDGRVRESANLDNKGMPFLLAILISAGIVKESPNKKVKLDFDKLVGKPVHFHYTAPPPSSGAGDTQYAKFRFVDVGTFNAEIAKQAQALTKDEQKPAAETKPVTRQTGRPGAQPAQAQTPAAETPAETPAAGDDLDFL